MLKVYKCFAPVNTAMLEMSNCHCFLSNLCISYKFGFFFKSKVIEIITFLIRIQQIPMKRKYRVMSFTKRFMVLPMMEVIGA